MTEFVGPTIEVGKCIAEPIKRQFNYLCCFNTNIQNLRDEAKKLDEAKEGLQGQVDAAMNNVQVIVPQVETWLDEVSKIQADMSGIEAEILNVRSGCLAIKSHFLLSRKATKMAAAMKELQDDGGKFGQICHPPPPAAMASSIPVGQTYELETRKHFEEKIMAALREKKVNMMGICGMGGVGKTTMAKKIMSRGRGESLFDEIVMVVVSQPIVMSSIQKQLFDSLGLEWKDESVSNAAYRLRNRLTNAKSILIVFDDLWEALMLEDLGIPDQKECTILLTSRSTVVFRQMGLEKLYHFQMKILSDIEALSLFKEKVGARADDPRLSPIAEKIVRECQGLPLALVTVGLALKDEEDKAIWENAEQELTTCNPEGIPDYIEKVYNPLRLSYDKLGNNEHAKSMFLLCCLFPEDHNIRIFDLCLYSWGLDMFNRIPSLRDTRNKVQASVKTLKSRSLLLDGSYEGYVKMHDVVRDVGIFIAEEKGLMSPSWPRKKSNCTWISLFDAKKITLPEGSAFPKLQFLLIEGPFSPPKEELPLSDNFFESAENLHVLSIQYYRMRCLPHTIKLLKNLRSLILVYCLSLEDISVVGELVSLEFLYCRSCENIKELPVEIGRLNQLKLLYIENFPYLETIAAGVISNLISLEELTLINSFTKWVSGASEAKKNAALCELNNLSRLTTLRIEIEDPSLAGEEIHLPNVVEFDITIGMNKPFDAYERTYGRAMQLKLERDANIGDWIHKFSRSSERLELGGEGFPKLQQLGNVVPFLNTESLTVKSCSMLEVMWDVEHGKEIGESSRITFPNLEKLILFDLPRLTTLCKGINSAEFPALTEMKIVGCPNLKSLVSDHRKCWDDDSLHLFCKSDKAAFRRLEKLEIDGYDSISRLWCDQIPIDSFTGLVRLTVYNCGNIKSLFSPLIAGNLVNLDFLRIENCREMVKVVKDKVDEVERSPFIKLEELELKGLPKLKAFCDWSCALQLPSLKSLYISECPEMERLLPGSLTSPISSDSFKNLETIKIIDCSMLEQVMLWNEEEVNGESSRITFPKLENLSLEHLPRLTSFCKGIQSIEFPLLTQMSITECPNLKRLVSSMENDHICSGAINHDADDSLHLFSEVVFGRLEYLIIDEYENSSSERSWSLLCDQIQVNFFTGLVQLEVSNCGNIKSLFSASIAGSLVNLKTLTIRSCGDMIKVVKDKVDEVERSPFIKLEELYLEDLPKLKAFCDWSCALQLPSLIEVEISGCPEMERFSSGNLTSPISSYSFKNLQVVRIFYCSMLEQVMLWSEEVNGESSCITFPKLENLKLCDLPRLTSFCKGIQSIEFPLLTKMEIEKCPNLKSVVSSTENDHICSGAVNHDSLHLFCKSQAAFGSLKYLIIGGYENSINERSWSLWSDQIPADIFTGLVLLTVSNCGNIKSLFSASIAENLFNLERLIIESYCEMVKVIEDEDEVERSPFIKLRKLTLENLPKLKAFCNWKCALQFPSLVKVYINECPEMERFSFGSLTTPKLERIRKNGEQISDYTKDLNDAVTWDRDSLHLDIL